MSHDREESRLPASEQAESETPRENWRRRFSQNGPYAAIYIRYLLPAVMGALLFILSFFDLVCFYMGGELYKMSLFAFYKNTLTSAHRYLGGVTERQANWFYGLLSTGAIVGALVYLLAMGLAVLCAVTAIRAFRAGHESAESNRMKLIFKIAFANRVALFLANLLFFIPALYAEYFSAVGQRFLSIGGESTIFVDSNVYFVLLVVYALALLALSLWMRKFELRKKMNMFLLWHPQTDEAEQELQPDEEA